MKRILARLKKLPPKKKVQLTAAVVLTLSLAVAIPVYAWFNNLKKAAEMYKIQYPNSLYLNAAHREDRIYFNVDELDMDELAADAAGNPINYNPDPEGTPEYREKDHRLYAFTVSGEGTTKFTLQLAHTNNNELEYEIYEATQTYTNPAVGQDIENFDYVRYDRHIGDNSENDLSFADELSNETVYYTLGSLVTGSTLNPKEGTSVLADDSIDEKCYAKTYGDNSNVEAHAIPLYWQAEITLNRNEIDRNTKQFRKFYILKVKWNETAAQQADRQGNTKETDLVYLAVKRIS